MLRLWRSDLPLCWLLWSLSTLRSDVRAGSADPLLVAFQFQSDGKAGWMLPVLDSAILGSVAKAQDKVTTADDDLDRIVRDKWRRHLVLLARECVDTTTRVSQSRYWSRWFAEMIVDEDDTFSRLRWRTTAMWTAMAA